MSKLSVRISMMFHRFQRKIEIISENLQLIFYKKKDREIVNELKIKIMELKFKEITEGFSIRQSLISSYAGPIINQIRDISLPLSYDTIKCINNINDNSPKILKKYYKEYTLLMNNGTI